MSRNISPRDLEDIVDGWQFWCPDKTCRNRTFSIDIDSDAHKVSTSTAGETKYLTVRILTCDRCQAPFVLGTNSYHDKQHGWDVRGQVVTRSDARMAGAAIMSGHGVPHHPMEFIAFTEPVQEVELPKSLPSKIAASYREAEYAVSKNKPISAGAALRNTVRLLVEANKITETNFKEAIKKLPFANEYIDALVNMKIIGDDTLHFEEYEIAEIRTATEILQLALADYYSKMQRLADLHKAVSAKGSKKAKN